MIHLVADVAWQGLTLRKYWELIRLSEAPRPQSGPLFKVLVECLGNWENLLAGLVESGDMPGSPAIQLRLFGMEESEIG